MSGSPEESSIPEVRRIGLVAGGGTFPHAVARAARRRGLVVVCAGIRHEVSPDLAAEVDVFKKVGVGKFGKILRYFRRHGVRHVSWAGWIRKERFFSPWRILVHLPDWRAVRLWFFRLRDRQSQTILHAIADELEEEGFRLSHSTRFCPELLIEEGVLTRRKPSEKQLADIAFGWRIAKRLADLDVGQSVAVSERATLAVEAVEGTDRNIRRAGEFCRRGFTVVKVAQEGHDMRFDVPAVGPRTIEAMREAGAAVLALEAGKTIVLEREEVVARADRHGLVVAAYREPPASGE